MDRNDLSVYVPAMEWLGLPVNVDRHGAYWIYGPNLPYQIWSERESALSVFLILQKLEEKGYVCDLLHHVGIDEDEFWLRLRGNHASDYLLTGSGETRTEAVLNAVLALYEGQKT